MPKRIVLTAGLAAAVIGGWVYWVSSGDDALASTADPTSQNSTTIADTWQWNNFAASSSDGSTADKSRQTSAVPQDVVGIYKILQSIKLDENGRVVPDQTLKEALEEGFNNLGPNLSAKELSELQSMIRTGLVGAAGDDAAHILGSYYQFRLAESEFNRQLEIPSYGSEGGPNRPTHNPLSAESRHNELVQLRRSYLGDEIADKLFSVEDAHARHMFAAIAIQQDANLTAEEKRVKQQALQEQLLDRELALGQLKPEVVAEEKVNRLRERGASSADIQTTRNSILGAERASELAAADREETQWQSNFNGFWQARRYVMQAGLDEAERERQLEQLLEQYFSPEERERARVTSSDWQARETK